MVLSSVVSVWFSVDEHLIVLNPWITMFDSVGSERITMFDSVESMRITMFDSVELQCLIVFNLNV